jgi:hypothetical protein
VLRHWWHHKIWFRRNLSKGTIVATRNRIGDVLALPRYALRDRRRLLRLLYRDLSPVIGLYSSPVVFILAAMWVTRWSGWGTVGGSPALGYLWAVVMASLVLFVLTSLRPLLFLGEAERYFEYSAPAYCTVLPIALGTVPQPARATWLWALLMLHLGAVYANLLYHMRQELARSRVMVSSDLAGVVRWCTENLESAGIATVPIKLSYALSAELADSDSSLRFYYRFILQDGETGFASFEEDAGGWMRFGDDWWESIDVFKIGPAEMRTKYGVMYVLVDKRYVDGLRRTWGPANDPILDAPAFENEQYLICQIPDLREAAVDVTS